MTLLSRSLTALRQPPGRAISMSADGSYTSLHELVEGQTPFARRLNRSNGDLVATFSNVFAAVRKRSQATAKATLVLTRTNGGGEPVEIPNHPALDALHNINESLTYKQGFGLIEQHKLTYGPAYWVKRYKQVGRLRVPVEFQVWEPDTVEIVPRADRPWVPSAFRRHGRDGKIETVAPQDMVWFRYMVDPRNPLMSLSPIGAIRTLADTGLEAYRYNQRFFDNNAMPAAILSAKDAGPGEASRIEQELARKFRGTDNSHRMMVTEGELAVTALPMAHKDMEFLAQMRWTKEEVASVFEMNPIDIGDSAQATKENLDGYTRAFWAMIENELENTIEELNEYFIKPDFGPEYALRAVLDVPALQPDRKLQAEIDEIRLRSASIVINEVREREGEESVPWGDVPVVSTTMAPLDTRTPAERDQAKADAMPPQMPPGSAPNNEPRRLSVRSLAEAEAEMISGWDRRLVRERRAIIAYLTHEAESPGRSQRTLEVSDVDLYDWAWWERYGPQVMAELAEAYEAALVSADFVETPLMPTHELAVRYARSRSAELLNLGERTNVVEFTRSRVREVVADSLEKGESIQTLGKRLEQEFAFSRSRAEMIANTEMAASNGRASVQAYSSRGYEGKRWMTAHDHQVCALCAENEAAGAIPLGMAFPSGEDHPGAHPRCRCSVAPVFELPRRTVRNVTFSDGRTATVEEVTNA